MLLSLPEQEIQGLQNIAKTAGLNQEQFNKTLNAMTQLQQQYHSQSEALKHREQTLNTQFPALAIQRGSFSDPEDAKEALAKISNEYHKNPTEKNRKRYINLANEVAEAKLNS